MSKSQELALFLAEDLKKKPLTCDDSAHEMLKLVQREMNESTLNCPILLEKLYNAVKNVLPSSIEAERSFSSSNNLITKLRTSLGDDTIDTLAFLRSDINGQYQ